MPFKSQFLCQDCVWEVILNFFGQLQGALEVQDLAFPNDFNSIDYLVNDVDYLVNFSLDNKGKIFCITPCSKKSDFVLI